MKSTNFTIVTPGAVEVRFDVGTAVGDNTALIDKVILTGPTVAAPEPGSLALLAVPALAMFARRRRA